MTVERLRACGEWDDAWRRTRPPRDLWETGGWASRARSLDARAKRVGDADPSSYVAQALAILRRHGVTAPDEVLDMGCGNGGLALPLARGGCRVLAADAEPRMLRRLEELAREGGDARLAHDASAGDVRTVVLRWEQDWPAAGVGRDCVDVAVASRSLEVDDLAAALARLEATARRACFVFVTTDVGEHLDDAVLTALGLPHLPLRDHQIVWNLLVAQGRAPSCEYLSKTYRRHFADADEACAWARRMARGAAYLYDPADVRSATAAAEGWARSLPADARGGLVYPQLARWACVSWAPPA